MRQIGGVEVRLHSLLGSALDGDEWKTSRPDRFTAEKKSQCPPNRRLDGHQSRSGLFQKEVNFLSRLGIEKGTVYSVA